MKFLINNLTWEIKEVNSDDSMLLVLGTFRYAAVHYNQQLICLSQTQTLEQKKQSLRHELAHAFLFSTQIDADDNKLYTQEMLCEFVALYGNGIEEIVKGYFDERTYKNYE